MDLKLTTHLHSQDNGLCSKSCNERNRNKTSFIYSNLALYFSNVHSENVINTDEFSKLSNNLKLKAKNIKTTSNQKSTLAI